MDFSDYKGIYVIAEVRDGKVEKVTGELLGQARKLAEKTGDPVEAVILGSGVKERAQDLIAYGADVVYVMESPLLAHYDGMAYEKELGALLKEKKPSAILFAATPYGRDLAPRIASAVVCGVTADVTELSVDEKTGLIVWSRPAMGGNIMADIISPQYRPQVGTVRPSTFDLPEADASRKGSVVEVPVTLTEKIWVQFSRKSFRRRKKKIPLRKHRSLWPAAAAFTVKKNGHSSMNWRIFSVEASVQAVRSVSWAGNRIVPRSARPGNPWHLISISRSEFPAPCSISAV